MLGCFIYLKNKGISYENITIFLIHGNTSCRVNIPYKLCGKNFEARNFSHLKSKICIQRILRSLAIEIKYHHHHHRRRQSDNNDSLPSWLPPTASMHGGKTPPNKCPGYDTKKSDGEVPVMAGALGNAEQHFFAIAPKSTLVWKCST